MPNSAIEQRSVGNVLLRHLAPGDFAALCPHLEREPLELGGTLSRTGEPIESLCFPEAGVVGFIDVLGDGQRLAFGLTGRDGVVGWPLALANDRWPHDTVVRAARGTAIKIDAAPLLAAMAARPAVQRMLLGYVSCITAQMMRTIASNLIHPIERRTARWILLYHDRVDGDEIAMTHEELSLMLGVRRSSITDALHVLEGDGAIRGLRGRIAIRDRQHLEALAGDTYGLAEREYRRWIGRSESEVPAS